MVQIYKCWDSLSAIDVLVHALINVKQRYTNNINIWINIFENLFVTSVRISGHIGLHKFELARELAKTSPIQNQLNMF